MDDISKLLLEKTEKISEEITEIKVILTKQHGSLEHHIKRSDSLEDHVIILENKIEPLEAHYKRLKIIGDWFMLMLKIIPVLTALTIAYVQLKKLL